MKETFEVIAAVSAAISHIAMAVKSIAELIMFFFISRKAGAPAPVFFVPNALTICITGCPSDTKVMG